MSAMEALLIAARTFHFAASVSLAGVFSFSCLILPGRGNAGPLSGGWPARLAWASLAVAVASGAAWLLINASVMSGEPLAAAVAQGALGTVLTRTQFGEDWLVRLALAVLLAACLVRRRRDRFAEWFALAVSASLLATLAWSGHGGATRGARGDLHLAADILHLLAAGAWVGALVPFAFLLADARLDIAVARAATRRFSMLGMVCVATLLATGIVNGWVLVGSLGALTATSYGRLLLVKIALFAVMVGIAAVNRSRLTPELDTTGEPRPARIAMRRLRRNALGEAGLGLAVLAVVGVLGTLPPGAPGHSGMHMAASRGHGGAAGPQLELPAAAGGGR